jgi:hypothetical protein
MSLASSVCPNKNCTGQLVEFNDKGHVVCNECSQVVQSHNHWLMICRLSVIDEAKLQSSFEAAGY